MTRTGHTVKIASHGGHAFGYAPSIFRWDKYQKASNKLSKKQRAYKRSNAIYNAICLFLGGGC